jgi:hypothetical protein
MQLERVETTEAIIPDGGSLLGELLHEMTSFVLAQSAEGRARLLGFFHLVDADQTSIELVAKACGKVILSIEAMEDSPN